MFTDMVGYVALSQKNEVSALQLLEEHRKILRPFFPKHNGQEIKTIGDAFLVEFASALEAVRCAYEIQQSLHELNSGRSVSEKFLLRIGVHLGDVIHAPNDVYGDAVNIASRIEPLADSGGICVTEQVYDQIKNKFEFPFSSIGRKELKNVSEPTEVFRLVLPWQKETGSKLRLDERRLAVLPLANISPNPNDSYFADGMTEELITVLSQLQGLRVIARTSSEHYAGREKRVSQIAQELQVGSVMEGSVRMAGQSIRVTVQLINAANEEHIWSENYDRKLDDIFGIQTEIAKQVAQVLKLKLLQEEKDRLNTRTTESIPAYVSYLKGRGLLHGRNPDELKKAKEFFEATIAEDSKYAPGYAGLADAYFLMGDYFVLPFQLSRPKAKELASKALQLDPNLAEAHATLGLVLSSEYEFAKANDEFRRALDLNPSYASAHQWYSFVLGALGMYRQALEELRLAEEADPLSIVILNSEIQYLALLGRKAEAEKKLKKMLEIDPDHWMAIDALASSHYLEGNYEKAIEVALAALALPKNSSNPSLKGGLVMTYGAMGDKENARKWLRELVAIPEENVWRNSMIALAYAALGDPDEFFVFANRAFKEKSLSFIDMRLIDKWMPWASKIHEDPRFSELFSRAGLRLEADL
jgi:TolB-like protein/Flp pilus assembly protein TadD